MPEDIYTDEERSLLDAWFARAPLGDHATNWLRAQGFERDPGRPYTPLDAWVGSLAVQHIQHRLPICGISLKDGEVILTRTRRKVRTQQVTGLVRFLFGINWADSGPGFSWPADYHLAWLPGYERFVLTSSADSPDAFGYCDLALGSVEPGANWKESVHQLLVADWAAQWELCEQWPWQELTSAGDISAQEALAWRQEAWSGHEWFAEPEEEWSEERDVGD